MKQRGVITGATGYIGSNLLRYLLTQDWEIYIIAQPEFGYSNIDDVKDQIQIIEYDTDIYTLIDFFKTTNPDVVFHLAAAVISDYKPEQISMLIDSNILFGTQVLEAMRFSKTKLIINTGSYWQNYNSNEYNPLDLYAATKESFEKIIQYYVDAHNFRCITLRLFDVYGENDTRPKLLNLLCQIAKDGRSLDVSLGEQLLDMVHISDVCTAYLKAYELFYENHLLLNNVFGVYTGSRISLKDMVYTFESIINKKINVNFGGMSYKEREVMNPCETYQRLPNWEAKISLVEGLKLFKNKSLKVPRNSLV